VPNDTRTRGKKKSAVKNRTPPPPTWEVRVDEDAEPARSDALDDALAELLLSMVADEDRSEKAKS
jgi:hypothetical protein